LTRLSTPVALRPDASIDLHMHTTYSDGRLPADQLIAHLAAEGFDLIAVTDHDRVDMVGSIQELGAAQGLRVLSGVEVSTEWQGKMGDVLCYGFDPDNNELGEITSRIIREQVENTRVVYEELLKRGYSFPRQQEILAKRGGAVRHPGDNARLLLEHGYAPDWHAAVDMIREAGFHSIHADMAETVDAAHRSGAVSLIAHPGRREQGFTFYEPDLLDQVRADVPIDGIEVYHPSHSPELKEIFLQYARKHDLLISAGSDSHNMPGRMPIKHRAENVRALLERVGVQIDG
jgi:predicted metal-dependent phosphoesterase TrpH